VWLSSTAGQFVYGSPPAEPAHSVYLGVVTRVQSNNGEIFVKVQNGYELDELHDVSAGSPSEDDVIAWNSSTSMWEKSAKTYTPYIRTKGSNTNITTTNSAQGFATSVLAGESYATFSSPTWTVTEEGVYRIFFSWDVSNVATSVTVAIQVNGTTIRSIIHSGNTTGDTTFYGERFAELEVGDTIEFLAVSGSTISLRGGQTRSFIGLQLVKKV
jgi:hypothetical protein